MLKIMYEVLDILIVRRLVCSHVKREWSPFELVELSCGWMNQNKTSTYHMRTKLGVLVAPNPVYHSRRWEKAKDL